MRRRRVAGQPDLFAPESPAVPVSMERRENLIALISALILEVMTSPGPVPEGSDDDPDHG